MNKRVVRDAALKALEERGADLRQMAEILRDLQLPYSPDLTVDECLSHIEAVLEKREVHHAILTGVALDVLAEKKALPEPLQSIVESDEPLYGIDEILALSVTNIYGSIGLTNFGHLDKVKPGIIAKFNSHEGGEVHTFLDDLISAIIAAAASRLAHSKSE